MPATRKSVTSREKKSVQDTGRQNTGDDRVLESQGLAAVTFTLQWSDSRAEHEDEMHVEKFSVWREADFLPPAIGAQIPGMRAGDSAQAALSAGEVTAAWDAARQVSGSPSGLCRLGIQAHGVTLLPRGGLFISYPPRPTRHPNALLANQAGLSGCRVTAT
jgi:hypothetical protein